MNLNTAEGKAEAANVVAKTLRDMVLSALSTVEMGVVPIPKVYCVPGLSLYCRILGAETYRKLVDKFDLNANGGIYGVTSVAWACILGVCDKDGNTIFQEEDAVILASDKTSGYYLQAMARFLYHINNMVTDDTITKAIAKNSEGMPSSTSD